MAKFRPGLTTGKEARELTKMWKEQQEARALDSDAPIPLFEFYGGYASDNGKAKANQHALWVKVTARSGLLYSWKEVYEDVLNGLPGHKQWEEKDGGAQGTITLHPLWEVNGHKIPIGKVVYARLAYYDEEYDWTWNCYYPNSTYINNVTTGDDIDENTVDLITDDTGDNYYDKIVITPTETITIVGLPAPDPVPTEDDTIVIVITNPPDSDFPFIIVPNDPGTPADNIITTPTGTQIVVPPNGEIEVTYNPDDGNWEVTDIIEPAYPKPYEVEITDNTDNLDIGKNKIVITDVTMGDWFLTGLITIPQEPGWVVTIVNDPTSENNLIITDTDNSSDPGNQFITTIDTSLTIIPGKTVDLLYIIDNDTGNGVYLVTGGSGLTDNLITDYPKYFTPYISEDIISIDENVVVQSVAPGGGVNHSISVEENIAIDDTSSTLGMATTHYLMIEESVVIEDSNPTVSNITAPPPPP